MNKCCYSYIYTQGFDEIKNKLVDQNKDKFFSITNLLESMKETHSTMKDITVKSIFDETRDFVSDVVSKN